MISGDYPVLNEIQNLLKKMSEKGSSLNKFKALCCFCCYPEAKENEPESQEKGKEYPSEDVPNLRGPYEVILKGSPSVDKVEENIRAEIKTKKRDDFQTALPKKSVSFSHIKQSESKDKKIREADSLETYFPSKTHDEELRESARRMIRRISDEIKSRNAKA